MTSIFRVILILKATAPLAPDIVENPNLMLPDITKENMEEFFKSVCDLYGEPPTVQAMEVIQEVMSVLCVPYKGSVSIVLPNFNWLYTWAKKYRQPYLNEDKIR